MTSFFMLAALAILLNLGLSLVRIVRGPQAADRMMAAQLMGTGGVAILVLLAQVEAAPGVLDVALLLALLAAFAAVAFVKARSPGGAGDPESDA